MQRIEQVAYALRRTCSSSSSHPAPAGSRDEGATAKCQLTAPAAAEAAHGRTRTDSSTNSMRSGTIELRFY